MDITTLAAIAASTLVSEDLASIAAGVLVRDRQLRLEYAVVACVAGVYLGDLALWLAGRWLRRRTAAFGSLQRLLDDKRLAWLGPRIDQHLGVAILVSRFVPGSRLPMYLAAGIWGRRPLAFAVWSLIAVMMWTPLLVAATVYFGEVVVSQLLQGISTGLPGSLLTAVTVFGVLRLVGRFVGRTISHYHQRLAQTIDTPI
jgi:membrane protein DedA with SNARE-associated domain